MFYFKKYRGNERHEFLRKKGYEEAKAEKYDVELFSSELNTDIEARFR